MFWLFVLAAFGILFAVSGLVIAGMSVFATIPFAVGFIGALLMAALSTVAVIAVVAS